MTLVKSKRRCIGRRKSLQLWSSSFIWLSLLVAMGRCETETKEMTVTAKAGANLFEECPAIFNEAAHIILRSPQLISDDPSMNLNCHSCIASAARSLKYPPWCRTPSMPGYDAKYPIAKDCQCLTLGLSDQCAQACLPNPLCVPRNSMKPSCTKCVEDQHAFCTTNATTGTTSWNATCYETCEAPICIRECEIDAQCHPDDTICSRCVRKHCPLDSTYASYARGWASACTKACYFPDCYTSCHRRCGDGYLLGVEEACDDGNILSGDGCSKNCQVEEQWACTDDVNQTSVCQPAQCGNGKLEYLEACDDGNVLNFDGCNAKCRVEKGYECFNDARRGSTSICAAKQCGDGIRAVGKEECDNGGESQASQTTGTSTAGKTRRTSMGCSSSCTIEKGYACAEDLNHRSFCTNVCGDGIRTVEEECDQGGVRKEGTIYGCDDRTCHVRFGFQCHENAMQQSNCTPILGDGYKTEYEECDTGDLLSLKGCNALGKIEPEYECILDNEVTRRSVCSLRVECGNGIKQDGEECDDGNNQTGDGCNARCKIEDGFACHLSTSSTEEKKSICQRETSVCGNGVKSSSEECDDGNVIGGDGCDAFCRIESETFDCTTETANNINSMNNQSVCVPQLLCGNGILQGEEECDNGHAPGCIDCKIAQGFTCLSTKHPLFLNRFNTSVCNGLCGDAYKLDVEACDNGNAVGCSKNCVPDRGYECQVSEDNAYLSICHRVIQCGNGIVEDKEDCDDGNNVSGDGCSFRCRIERTFQCSQPIENETGRPSLSSVCAPEQCTNVRKDWMHLTRDEKDVFFHCMNEAFRREMYQQFVGIHVYAPNDLYAHYTNGFVAWHRKWLMALESMLRGFGGRCTCVSLPYWDWGEEAALMQTNKCKTKEECSPVMREWGGGGNVDDEYRTIPVWNDPNALTPVDTSAGYCVLNNVTKHWRSNAWLGPQYIPTCDATCPTIRRGWNDWRDRVNNQAFASPFVATSFVSIASSIASSRTFATFANVLSGDMHILPHDKTGGFLVTFLSPADPLFILHHTNIDRIYAIWETCHGCDVVTASMRKRNSACYTSLNNQDLITKNMTFRYYNPTTKTKTTNANATTSTYELMSADDASELVEFWPRHLKTPGDMMSIASLGYKYGVDDLDEQLYKMGTCPSMSTSTSTSRSLAQTSSFVLLSTQAKLENNHVDNKNSMNRSTSNMNKSTSTSNKNCSSTSDVDDVKGALLLQSEQDDALSEYVAWLQSTLQLTETLVTLLQQLNLFDVAWLKPNLESASQFVLDIGATCECMHAVKRLSEKMDYQHAVLSDVSAYTKRRWNRKLQHDSCFHRLNDATEYNIRSRQYCQVILSPDFTTSMTALVDLLQDSSTITYMKDSWAHWFTGASLKKETKASESENSHANEDKEEMVQPMNRLQGEFFDPK